MKRRLIARGVSFNYNYQYSLSIHLSMIALLTLTDVLFLLLGLVFLAFLVYTLHHITKRDLPADSKFLWIMAVLVISPVGMVLYYLIGANQPRVSN